MRVIGGSAKGKKLLAVPGSSTRPVLDRVKTSLLDILRPVIADVVFLDAFAGSGSVGIEALSQGANFCIFLDTSKKAVETIKRNLELTGLSKKAEVRSNDAFTYIRNSRKSFDLIFVAPPQYKGLWIEALHAIAERPTLVNQGGQIVVQIDPKEYEPVDLSAFYEVDQRKYGNTLLVFYRWNLQ